MTTKMMYVTFEVEVSEEWDDGKPRYSACGDALGSVNRAARELTGVGQKIVSFNVALEPGEVA